MLGGRKGDTDLRLKVKTGRYTKCSNKKNSQAKHNKGKYWEWCKPRGKKSES